MRIHWIGRRINAVVVLYVRGFFFVSGRWFFLGNAGKSKNQWRCWVNLYSVDRFYIMGRYCNYPLRKLLLVKGWPIFRRFGYGEYWRYWLEPSNRVSCAIWRSINTHESSFRLKECAATLCVILAATTVVAEGSTLDSS